MQISTWTASCGMHIHASKPGNYRQMNRLMTMLIDYEKELCGVSLRHQSRSGSVGSMELSRLGDLQTGDAK